MGGTFWVTDFSSLLLLTIIEYGPFEKQQNVGKESSDEGHANTYTNQNENK